MKAILMFAIPTLCMAQLVDTFDVKDKLRFHGENIYSPSSLAESAAIAGILQARDAPYEWGHGGGAFGKRLASSVAYSAIHETLAFGLDSALHQDPRYVRSLSAGFWRRTGHALRGTFITRTDSGGETLATWRLGSAYSAAFISNQWCPDRVNTTALSVKQGSLQLVFDFAGNLREEFWPDVKRKMLHRKP